MGKWKIFRFFGKLFYAECSNSFDFGIKKFFCNFDSGKFSTKVEKFQLCMFGLKFNEREGLEPENKILPKWKIFHQKWKHSTTAECCNWCDFGNKIFRLEIFWSGKFSTKVKKISTSSIWDGIWQTRMSRCRKKTEVGNFPPLQNVPIHAILEYFFFWKWKNFPLYGKKSTFSIGVEVGRTWIVRSAKKFLKLKIFHQKWKSCSTRRAKNFSQSWKFSTKKWKSCSTRRANLARAVF